MNIQEESNINYNYNPNFKITLGAAVGASDGSLHLTSSQYAHRGRKTLVCNMGDFSGVALVAVKNANTPDQEKESIAWNVDEDGSNWKKNFKDIIKDDKNFTFLIIHLTQQNSPNEMIEKLYTKIGKLAQKILAHSPFPVSTTPLQKLIFYSDFANKDLLFALDFNGNLMINYQQIENDDYPNVSIKFPQFRPNKRTQPMNKEKNPFIDEKGEVIPKNRQELNKIYRRLARKIHPDKSNDRNAKEKFQVLQNIYESLCLHFKE
jgi:hypothetical protein